MMAKAGRLEVAVPTVFRGDFWKTREYTGYTRHDSWNGWACPYFEKAVADQIMADLEADASEAGSLMTLIYNDEFDHDAYDVVEQSEDNEDASDVIDTVHGFDLVTVDGIRHVFAVGVGLWTWQEKGVHFDRDQV
jgi:hypothetical protein